LTEVTAVFAQILEIAEKHHIQNLLLNASKKSKDSDLIDQMNVHRYKLL